MAKNTINDKSKQISIRIPHDAFDGMESVKLDGESNAGFIVTAMRGEIARRQAEGRGENPWFLRSMHWRRWKKLESKLPRRSGN